jgi:pimeloyl-ACP methyl ester carboxylesterase
MTTNKSDNLFSTPDSMTEYLIDAGQRSVLYWDTMRLRGNQYLDHIAQSTPHVLKFDYELIINGRSLPEPVNYGLVKIIPPKGVTIDERKRPFVVIDPRAGHGPGIGGFKADSEIGVALAEGHPCYFIGFTPMPEPNQTIETVMRAEAYFLKRVNELHSKADGKPVVIGNCQAGWAVMMLAATLPDLCGPIIVAGAPLSYWEGVRGQNPMRYSGGMLGGSWVSTLFSDMGDGKFDGAWLVQNFESLNPANTLWGKQYNLYSQVDTEAERYLKFERWWGGHVFLSGAEIKYIVNNLFVGNKLSSAEIVTSGNINVDLRKIRSPIVCFCSKGDNITSPQQALGWITDLYHSVDDIHAAGQTIVYCVHDHIGHLGIFVSGSVARKEHFEFASNIDFIDCLPPGLYEAVIEKTDENDANPDLVVGDHISRFERRTLDDIRALGGNTLEDNRCFATVARLSEVCQGLYRTTAQPMVRAMTTEKSAELMRRLHPLRLGYELLSDRNPMMKPVESAAKWVPTHRQPVKPDNPFLQWQTLCSDMLTANLNIYRDWRDMMTEQMFFGIYSQPWLQALMGLRASDDPPRKHPGHTSEHLAFIEWRKREIMAGMEIGGPREAVLRGLIYVRMPEGVSDERGFEMIRRIRRIRAKQYGKKPLVEFKQTYREQFFMVLMDERRAIAAIPQLLAGIEDEGPELFKMIRKVATASGSLGTEAQSRLAEIKALFIPDSKKGGQK